MEHHHQLRPDLVLLAAKVCHGCYFEEDSQLWHQNDDCVLGPRVFLSGLHPRYVDLVVEAM